MIDSERIEGLNEQRELLIRKLNALEKKKAIETDTAENFKLEHQIKDLKQKLELNQENLNEVGSSRVYQALLRLDYSPQELEYEIVIQKTRTALFIIRGEPEHGQLWLLHRLLGRPRGTPIIIRADQRTKDTGTQALWRELAKKFSLALPATPSKVIEKVCAFSRTQDFIIIMHGIGRMNPAYVHALIDELWVPLATGAGKQPRLKNRFMMFLIDTDGESIEWNLPGLDKHDNTWTPQTLIRLPVLQRFGRDLISKWISHSNELPLELRTAPEDAADRVLHEADGIPEAVFYNICHACDMDWHYCESRWAVYR